MPDLGVVIVTIGMVVVIQLALLVVDIILRSNLRASIKAAVAIAALSVGYVGARIPVKAEQGRSALLATRSALNLSSHSLHTTLWQSAERLYPKEAAELRKEIRVGIITDSAEAAVAAAKLRKAAVALLTRDLRLVSRASDEALIDILNAEAVQFAALSKRPQLCASIALNDQARAGRLDEVVPIEIERAIAGLWIAYANAIESARKSSIARTVPRHESEIDAAVAMERLRILPERLRGAQQVDANMSDEDICVWARAHLKAVRMLPRDLRAQAVANWF